MPTPEQIAQALIKLRLEELRTHLMAFKQTPLGQVLSRAGRRVIEARNEGRSINGGDVIDFCDELSEVLLVEEEDDG